MPRARRHARRRAARPHACRLRRRACRPRARPRVDDRLDERGRQGEAAPLRHPGADGQRGGPGLGSGARAARGEVPALRLAQHPRARPVRVDLVQGALRVPRLPRALRLLQGALMAARNLGSTTTHPGASPSGSATELAGAASVAGAFLQSAVGGESLSIEGGPKRRRARFHPLTVAEVRPLTDDAVEVTFDVPDELADDYTYLPGQYVAIRATLDGKELRRSYSICRPPQRPSAGMGGSISVAIKRDLGGR